MPKSSLQAYVTEDVRAKFDVIKEREQGKNPGIPLSDSATLIAIIDQTYQKIVGQQTNADRITKIIEHVDRLDENQDQRLSRIEQLLLGVLDEMRGSHEPTTEQRSD